MNNLLYVMLARECAGVLHFFPELQAVKPFKTLLHSAAPN